MGNKRYYAQDNLYLGGITHKEYICLAIYHSYNIDSNVWVINWTFRKAEKG